MKKNKKLENPLIRELVAEIKRWFSKSIIPDRGIPFDDVNTFDKVIDIFITDYQRYFQKEKSVDISKICLYPCLQVVLLYRIAHMYFMQKKEDIALKYSTLGRFLSNIEIYYSSDIGHSFQVYHGLGTVIGKNSKIGNNVTIYQGVTIGTGLKNDGRPTLGDNVIIFAGSKIIGRIKIGNNSIVGANSVCLEDVPSDTIVAGAPARVISKIKNR
jgi:serine O-acetyltransferase